MGRQVLHFVMKVFFSSEFRTSSIISFFVICVQARNCTSQLHLCEGVAPLAWAPGSRGGSAGLGPRK